MSGFRGMGMHRVRWVADGEPEMQCEHCFDFWPLTTEFWLPRRGIRQCLACARDATRERTKLANRRRRSAQRRQSPGYDSAYWRRTSSVLARIRRNAA